MKSAQVPKPAELLDTPLNLLSMLDRDRKMAVANLFVEAVAYINRHPDMSGESITHLRQFLSGLRAI